SGEKTIVGAKRVSDQGIESVERHFARLCLPTGPSLHGKAKGVACRALSHLVQALRYIFDAHMVFAVPLPKFEDECPCRQRVISREPEGVWREIFVIKLPPQF